MLSLEIAYFLIYLCDYSITLLLFWARGTLKIFAILLLLQKYSNQLFFVLGTLSEDNIFGYPNIKQNF